MCFLEHRSQSERRRRNYPFISSGMERNKEWIFRIWGFRCGWVVKSEVRVCATDEADV